MWSEEEDEPTTITEEYTTSVYSYDSTQSIFISTRALDPGNLYSYVIPLDSDFNMCWAFADEPDTDEYHGGNKGILSVNFPSTGGCSYTEVASSSGKIHGVIMWISWTLISLV